MTQQKLSKDLIFFLHYASDLMNFAEKTNDALVANLRHLGEEHAEKNGGWDQHSFWDGAKIDIRYEGVKQGFYTKGLAKVYIHGTEFESVIYVATDSKPGVPRSGYLDKLIAGVEFFHGHDEWIEEIGDFDNIIYMKA